MMDDGTPVRRRSGRGAWYYSWRVLAGLIGLSVFGMVIALLARQTQELNKLDTLTSDVVAITAIRNTSCDPPAPLNQCVSGYSAKDGLGNSFCLQNPVGVGTPCTSICYQPGTTTSCDNTQTCVGADASKCRGDCIVNTSTALQPIYEFASAQCTGQLQIYPFYSFNHTLQSSCLVWQWGWVLTNLSGYPAGDCQSIGKCTWYAAKFAVGVDDGDLPFPAMEPGSLSCADTLNMTAAQKACLRTTELPMTGAQANQFFYHSLEPFAPSESFEHLNFSATLCVFQYACAGSDISAYVTPFYLVGGKKRQIMEEDTGVAAAAAERFHFARFATMFATDGERTMNMLERVVPVLQANSRAQPAGRKRTASNICGT